MAAQGSTPTWPPSRRASTLDCSYRNSPETYVRLGDRRDACFRDKMHASVSYEPALSTAERGKGRPRGNGPSFPTGFSVSELNAPCAKVGFDFHPLVVRSGVRSMALASCLLEAVPIFLNLSFYHTGHGVVIVPPRRQEEAEELGCKATINHQLASAAFGQ